MEKTARPSVQKEFNWPYPRNADELVNLLVIGISMLLIGLIVTAVRYNAYKEQTLQKGQLVLTATALSSYATESAKTLSFANSHKVTQNFREAYADQIADQVQNTYGYVASRQVAKPYQTEANQLVQYGTAIRQALVSVAQPASPAQVNKARQAILQAEQGLTQVSNQL